MCEPQQGRWRLAYMSLLGEKMSISSIMQEFCKLSFFPSLSDYILFCPFPHSLFFVVCSLLFKWVADTKGKYETISIYARSCFILKTWAEKYSSVPTISEIKTQTKQLKYYLFFNFLKSALISISLSPENNEWIIFHPENCINIFLDIFLWDFRVWDPLLGAEYADTNTQNNCVHLCPTSLWFWHFYDMNAEQNPRTSGVLALLFPSKCYLVITMTACFHACNPFCKLSRELFLTKLSPWGVLRINCCKCSSWNT